jgi:hypothetical protein
MMPEGGQRAWTTLAMWGVGRHADRGVAGRLRTVTADIISSSPDEKDAKENLDLFMLPLMMTAVTKPREERAR